MIDETSYASDVADELELTSSAYAEDVTGKVDLDNTAYAEDVAEAINEQPSEPVTLRVMQYNIGHFNMGMEAGNVCLIGSNHQKAQTYSQFFNYEAQLQRWKDRIDDVDADIIGMPEWNNNFGYNGNSLVSISTTGIFNGYDVKYGSQHSNYWWINALATLSQKFTLTNVQQIDVSNNCGNPPYILEGTITVENKQVVVAVTHLNWNQSQVFHDSRVEYEIPFLVNRYKNVPYLILCGDFNTEGTYGGAKDPSNKTGLAEFQPFIDAGFVLANSASRPLLTSIATNSRPDQSLPQSPYAYIDNIIVRGFTMSNVYVIDDGDTVNDENAVGNITDHCAVVCDLTLIDNE